ncbi:MAG: trypsin-like peptidase domain-containing protein [Woeseia sp.]
MKAGSRTVLGLLVLAVVSTEGHAKNAEEMFADAARYTVRIDATISRAFIEDEVGAQHGAGFIVDEKRKWVMTNAHVVGYSPAKLRVEFSDGTTTDASKIYVDPYIDVAIIEFQTASSLIREAPLGCDQRPGVGHPVGAFGHPWGLNFTGTRGVVSGATNKLGSKLLQIDAPINGGNSGGPLISMASGKVVGISSASLNKNDDQNTNFGVPIDQACQILNLLLSGKDPSPPQLDATFYRLLGDNGPLIVARSFLPEHLIQLRPGDEIIAAKRVSVSHESDLIQSLRGSLESVRVQIRRGGGVIEIEGHLNPVPRIVERRGLYFAGILFAEAGYRDRQSLAIGHDVMIHDIEAGSEASALSLSVYDYVSAVKGEPVESLNHLRKLLSDVKENSEVQIDFLRFVENGNTRQLFYSLRRNVASGELEEIGEW